jgi:hypothetical protein
MNKEKDTFKSRHSNVHLIDYDSYSSSNNDKEVYDTKFIWPSKEKFYSCSSLKPANKSHKKKLNLLSVLV